MHLATISSRLIKSTEESNSPLESLHPSLLFLMLSSYVQRNTDKEQSINLDSIPDALPAHLPDGFQAHSPIR